MISPPSKTSTSPTHSCWTEQVEISYFEQDFRSLTYPEIDNNNFKSTLCTFQQWSALKMRVCYGISLLLLLTSSYKAFSGYASTLDQFH